MKKLKPVKTELTKHEDYAIILDYLPEGYPSEKKMMPIAQAVGEKNFALLQLIPRKGETLQINERVYIGNGKRDKIYYILGKLPPDQLTQNSKYTLLSYFNKIPIETLTLKLVGKKCLDSKKFGYSDDTLLFDSLPVSSKELEEALKIFLPNRDFKVRTQIGMKNTQMIMHGRYYQH